MTINVKVDSDASSAELDAQEAAIQQPQVPTISLEIRKTLDGKIMILDHMHMDIIIDTANKTIVTFPKEHLDEEVYNTQNSYFKYLTNEGVIIPESVIGGSVYGSLEASYPDSIDEGVSESQVVMLSTKNFLDSVIPALVKQEYIESEIEDHLVDPTDADSTELGEVPQEPKKGSNSASRIRRYLSGYGYY